MLCEIIPHELLPSVPKAAKHFCICLGSCVGRRVVVLVVTGWQVGGGTRDRLAVLVQPACLNCSLVAATAELKRVPLTIALHFTLPHYITDGRAVQVQ